MESIENDDKMDLCVRVSFVMLRCELDTKYSNAALCDIIDTENNFAVMLSCRLLGQS